MYSINRDISLFGLSMVFIIVSASASLTFTAVNFPDFANGISYRGVCVDSTGQYLAAITARYQYGMLTSNNFGITWTHVASGTDLNLLACDSTGKNLFASVGRNNGYLATSTDYGVTWANTGITSPSNDAWWSISSDSTGQYLAGGVYGKNTVSLSSDFGATWLTSTIDSTTPISFNSIIVVTSTQVFVGDTTGLVYKSVDYGTTWLKKTNALGGNIFQFAVDSTGQYVVSIVYNMGIYVSTDHGETWPITSAPKKSWYSVTSDSTGRVLVAGTKNPPDKLYSSSDYGSTWVVVSGSTSGNYNSLASSADGSLVLAGGSTTLYLGTSPKVPTSAPSSSSPSSTAPSSSVPSSSPSSTAPSSAVPSSLPSSTSPSSSAALSNIASSSSSSESKVPQGYIAAAVIAGIFGTITLALIIYIACVRKQREKSDPVTDKYIEVVEEPVIGDFIEVVSERFTDNNIVIVTETVTEKDIRL